MMLVGMIRPTTIRTWVHDNRIPKMVSLLLVAMIIWSLTMPATVSAIAGFGEYISEKLLGNGTNEMLYLGDGTNELTVLGSGPAISTVGATSSSAGNIVTMTMNGNLQSLNGMPRADVWFRWGYAPGAMVFTTSTVTVTSTGVQTASINPNAGTAVYYQFASSTDGTTYGSVLSLPVVGGSWGQLLDAEHPIAYCDCRCYSYKCVNDDRKSATSSCCFYRRVSYLLYSTSSC